MPAQEPLLQTSLYVQALPSLQPVLSGLFATVQPPFPSQMDEDWHMVGVQLYELPAHAPLLQTSLKVHVLPSLQPVLSALFAPSTQTGAPVEQSVVPLRQKVGLVVQAALCVQATQAPALLQTMLVPQLAPAAFSVLLLQTIVPVLQLVMPV